MQFPVLFPSSVLHQLLCICCSIAVTTAQMKADILIFSCKCSVMPLFILTKTLQILINKKGQGEIDRICFLQLSLEYNRDQGTLSTWTFTHSFILFIRFRAVTNQWHHFSEMDDPMEHEATLASTRSTFMDVPQVKQHQS